MLRLSRVLRIFDPVVYKTLHVLDTVTDMYDDGPFSVGSVVVLRSDSRLHDLESGVRFFKVKTQRPGFPLTMQLITLEGVKEEQFGVNYRHLKPNQLFYAWRRGYL